MDGFQIICDNIKAENGSFMYLLHERDTFDISELNKLCESINNTKSYDLETYSGIEYILRQTWQHIAYHFDPGDLSKIKNLPNNYCEYIENLEASVAAYRTGLIKIYKSKTGEPL